MSTKTD